MKHSLFGQLRESRGTSFAKAGPDSLTQSLCKSLRESRQHRRIREMFGDDGPTIEIYGKAMSEIQEMIDAATKKQASIVEKFSPAEGEAATDVQNKILEAFNTFFEEQAEALNKAFSALKSIETGGVPVADLQPAEEPVTATPSEV